MTDARPYSKATQLAYTANRKKYRRQVAGRKRWEQIRSQKLGPCIRCTWLGVTQTLESTLHHCVPRDRGGGDTEACVVSLCGHGTAGCHGLIESGDQKACQEFADALQNLDGEAYAYAVDKLGEDGFLRLYKVRFEAA